MKVLPVIVCLLLTPAHPWCALAALALLPTMFRFGGGGLGFKIPSYPPLPPRK
jgi:hypothetical protein